MEIPFHWACYSRWPSVSVYWWVRRITVDHTSCVSILWWRGQTLAPLQWLKLLCLSLIIILLMLWLLHLFNEKYYIKPRNILNSLSLKLSVNSFNKSLSIKCIENIVSFRLISWYISSLIFELFTIADLFSFINYLGSEKAIIFFKLY